jgi:hypothetical protein
MKHLLKAYTGFTRTERMGLLALFLIIGVLLTTRLTMPYWAKPSITPQEEQQLTGYFAQQKTTTPVPLIAGNHNKKQQNNSQHTDYQNPETSPETTTNNNNSQQNTLTPALVPNTFGRAEGDVYSRSIINNNKSQHQSPAALRETNLSPLGGAGGGFLFDPNTIDSAGLRQLGLREKTTSIFLNWRRKGKRFYKKEELKKLYTLTPQEYKRLEPYIVINNTLRAHQYNYEDYGPLPEKVNINTADSITLIRLRGIGPAIAHRILVKRRSAGSFASIEEVLAVYHFSDEVCAYLQQKLVID